MGTSRDSGATHLSRLRIVLRALPPAVLAALLAVTGRTTAATVLAGVAVVVLFLGLISPSLGSLLDRGLARVGSAAAGVVGQILSRIIWVATVLPIWVWNKLRRRNSLELLPPTLLSNWAVTAARPRRRSDGATLSPDRSGTSDTGYEPASARFGGAIRVGVVACLATVLVVSVVRPGARSGVADKSTRNESRDRSAGSDGEPIRARVLDAKAFDGMAVDSYAHEGEPWAPQMFGELSQLPYRPDPYLGFVLHDFKGEFVNVVDGHRTGYTPEDPELVVWFFGGSTMFGIGQRDDYTIPSMVAKFAEKDGLRIRCLNFGFSGFVNWQELQLFQQLLTSKTPRPDMAVFYDGVNDRGLGSFRADVGADNTSTITRYPLDDDEENRMKWRYGNVEPMPWGPERRALEIELSAEQYRRGVQLARQLGDDYKVPVVNFWQPQPFAKVPHPADDQLWKRLDFNPAFLADSTDGYKSVREASGVHPIDLTHVLDDITVPVYFDSSHTNELGARTVAKAMYAQLKPRLVKASKR